MDIAQVRAHLPPNQPRGRHYKHISDLSLLEGGLPQLRGGGPCTALRSTQLEMQWPPNSTRNKYMLLSYKICPERKTLYVLKPPCPVSQR